MMMDDVRESELWEEEKQSASTRGGVHLKRHMKEAKEGQSGSVAAYLLHSTLLYSPFAVVM